MTKYDIASSTALRAQGSFARVLAGPFGKHIALEAPNEKGTGDDDAVAKAAAEAAAKAAREKAEAEAAEKAAKEAAEKLEKEKLEKKDGMSDAEHKLLRELMEAKNSNKDLKGKAAEADALKKALEDLGGLESLKALVEAKKDAEKADLEKKGEFDRLKAMIVEENQKKVKEAEEKAEATAKELSGAQRVIDDLTIGAAFAASTVVGDLVLTPAKTRQVYGDHFERVDGVIVAYDKPKGAANRTKLVDASGEPVSFDVALKKLVDADPDREKLLKSKMISGSGSKPTGDKTAEKTVSGGGISRIAAALEARKKA